KYNEPSQIQTDLLVLVVDKENGLFDLGGSSVNELVARVSADINQKRIKKEYFTALDSNSSIRSLVIFSTALNPAYNVWESLKTFVARSIRMAQDLGLNRISILLNTDAAVPFIGKAVEGAIVGGYTFDKYRKEKTDLGKLQIDIVALKRH